MFFSPIPNTVTRLFVTLIANVCVLSCQQFEARNSSKIKRQARPITGPRCLKGSRKLRFPDYVTMAQDDGKVVSLKHRPLFNPRKYSWYSFLLEAESTPGP